MAVLNLGKVRGDDGFSPEITVEEDSLNSYRLRIKSAAVEFTTPNLRGPMFKAVVVNMHGDQYKYVPLTDLGLDPSREYIFYAGAHTDWPPVYSISAWQRGDDIYIVAFTAPDAKFGGLAPGSAPLGNNFLVNLLCVETGKVREV